jgi:fibronectin-binding autotransporter adhesin
MNVNYLSAKILKQNVNSASKGNGEDAFGSALHLSMRPWWTKLTSALLIGGMALSTAGRLKAENYNWVGGGSPVVGSNGAFDWTTGGNWTPQSVWPYPRSAGDTVAIGTLGTNGTAPSLDILLNSGTYKVGSISVSAPADGTLTSVSVGALNGVIPDFSLQNSGTLAASLNAGAGISLNLSADVTLGSDLLINSDPANTGSVFLGGALSGAKSVEVKAGTVILSGTNTYTGGTAVKNASVSVGAGSTSQSVFGSGALSVDGGTVDVVGTSQVVTGTVTLKGDGTLADSVPGGSLSASGFTLESGTVTVVLAGTGALSKVTAGTVTISSTSTYSGGTDVSGGSLIVAGGGLGGGTLTVQGTGVVLDVTNSALSLDPGASFVLKNEATVMATGGPGSISADTIDLQSGTVDAVLTGGTLTKSTAGTVVLNAVNTYVGETNVTGGTLQVGTSTATIGAGSLRVDGGTARSATVDLNGTTQSVSDLSLKNGGVISDSASAGGGTLAAGVAALLEDGEVNVVLTGAATLIKSGTGTVSLSKDNTFTGGSTLSAGTVILGGSVSALGQGNVILQGGTSGDVTITLAAKDNSAPYVISNAVTSQGAVGFGTATNSGTVQIGGQVTLDDAVGAVAAHKWDVATGTDVKLVGSGLATGGTASVSFEKSGGGSVSLDTAATAQLTEFKISQGTVIVGTANALGVLPGSVDGVRITLNGGTLQVDSAELNDVSSGGAVSNVDVSDTSKIVLNAPGQNALTLGSLTFSAGGKAIEVGAGTGVGSSGTTTLTFGEAQLHGGSANTFNVSNGTSAGTTVVLSGTVSGAGAKLVKTGDGTLELSVDNTYSGGTQIDAGTVRMGAGQNRALGTGTLAINGGLLDMNGNTVDAGSSFTISSGTGGGGQAINGTISVSNVINAVINSGSVSLDVVLTGNARLEKTGAETLVLSKENTYAGGTEVKQGVLQLGVDNALNTNKLIKVSGGTLDLAGHSQDAGLAEVSLNAGSVKSSVGTGTLSAGKFEVNVAPGRTVTVESSSKLSGSGALEKDGAGSILLKGSNSYAGGTVIRGGAVDIEVDGALGTNGVTLQGGTLNGVGTSQVVVANAVSVASPSHVGGRIQLNDVSGSGAIVVDTAGSDVKFANPSASFSGGVVARSGTVTASSDNALGTGAIVVSGGSINLTGTTQNVSAVTLTSGQLSGGVAAPGTINVSGGGAISISGGTVTNAVLSSQSGVATISGLASIVGGSVLAETVTLSGGNVSSGGSLIGTTVNVSGGAVSSGFIEGVTVGLSGGNVSNTALTATTANLSGASVSGGRIDAATVNVSAGAVNGGASLGGTNSTVNVSGGAVSSGTIEGVTVGLSGGNVSNTALTATTANLSGASVSGGRIDAATVNVSAGAVNGGASLGGTNSNVTVSGGAVSDVTIQGTTVGLSGGNVTNTAVTATTANLSGASVSGGQISAATVNVSSGAVSGGASLGGANSTVNISGGAVSSGTVQGTTVGLSGGNITNTAVTATTANLSGASVSGGQISAATVNVSSGAVSGGASLGGANSNVTVSGGAVSDVTIQGTTVGLSGGNVSNTAVTATTANLSGASVSGGQISAATVNVSSGAVSGGASLGGANSSVNISGGAVSSVTIQGTTVALSGGNVSNTAVTATNVDINVGVQGSGLAVTTGTANLNGGVLSVSSIDAQKVNIRAGSVSGGVIVSAQSIAAEVSNQASVGASITSVNGLTKTGGGNLTLSGANTGLKGLAVTEGKVTSGAVNALGSGAITVGPLGSIDLGSQAQTSTGATISGKLSNGELNVGSGTVNVVGATAELTGVTVKAETGAVNLNGGNVSGASDIRANTVALGDVNVDGGKIGSSNKIVATVANNVTVSASVTGANGLDKRGAGKLTLSGNNVGLNGLSVSEGTVEVNSSAALGSGAVKIAANASVNSAVDLVQGASVYTVNGNLTANSLTVGRGQTLNGDGVINAGVRLVDGSIAPGNSPGTLAVGTLSGVGDYVWERVAPVKNVATGTYSIGNYDRIVVANANNSTLSGISLSVLDGTVGTIPIVAVDPKNPSTENLARDQVRMGAASSLRYDGIITSGTGSFGNVPKFGGINSAVIQVRLENSTGLSIDLVVDRSSYAEFARGKSGEAFAKYLDSQLTPDHYDSVGILGQTLRTLDATLAASDVSSHLRRIDASAAYASLYTVGIRRANAVAIPVEDHLDALAASAATDSVVALAAGAAGSSTGTITPASHDHELNWTAWTAAYGSRFQVDADSSAGGIQSSDNGATLGLEHHIGNLRLGAVASVGQGSVNFDDPSVRVESDHWHVGGYGSVAFGPVTVDASALFGSSDESSVRSVTGGSARGDFATNDTQVGVGVAVNLTPRSSGWQVTPVARLKYVSYKQDGFAETGPGGALLFNTGDVNEDTVVSKLGLRVAHRNEISKGFTLGVDGAAYWVHDFNADGRNLALRLQGATGSFTGTGRNGQSNTAQLNLGVQATVADSVTFRLSGQQEIGSNRTQSTGLFAVGLSF